jgi:hypothetical protein
VRRTEKCFTYLPLRHIDARLTGSCFLPSLIIQCLFRTEISTPEKIHTNVTIFQSTNILIQTKLSNKILDRSCSERTHKFTLHHMWDSVLRHQLIYTTNPLLRLSVLLDHLTVEIFDKNFTCNTCVISCTCCMSHPSHPTSLYVTK